MARVRDTMTSKLWERGLELRADVRVARVVLSMDEVHRQRAVLLEQRPEIGDATGRALAEDPGDVVRIGALRARFDEALACVRVGGDRAEERLLVPAVEEHTEIFGFDLVGALLVEGEASASRFGVGDAGVRAFEDEGADERAPRRFHPEEGVERGSPTERVGDEDAGRVDGVVDGVDELGEGVAVRRERAAAVAWQRQRRCGRGAVSAQRVARRVPVRRVTEGAVHQNNVRHDEACFARGPRSRDRISKAGIAIRFDFSGGRV